MPTYVLEGESIYYTTLHGHMGPKRMRYANDCHPYTSCKGTIPRPEFMLPVPWTSGCLGFCRNYFEGGAHNPGYQVEDVA